MKRRENRVGEIRVLISPKVSEPTDQETLSFLIYDLGYSPLCVYVCVCSCVRVLCVRAYCVDPLDQRPPPSDRVVNLNLQSGQQWMTASRSAPPLLFSLCP